MYYLYNMQSGFTVKPEFQETEQKQNNKSREVAVCTCLKWPYFPWLEILKLTETKVTGINSNLILDSNNGVGHEHDNN